MPNNPKGTGYTNLQQYLAANRGNRLSNALASNVQQKTDEAGQQLNKEKTDFNKQLSDTQTGINQARTGAEQVSEKLNTNPAAIGNDDVNQYRTFQNLNYGGPAGLANEGTVVAKANNAAALGGLAGSREGRQELLRNFINKSNYNKPGQQFDSVVMGNDVDAKLRNARQSAQQIPGQLNSAVEGSKNRVANTQNELAANKRTVGEAVNNVGKTLSTTIADRVKQKQDADTAFRQALASKDLNALTAFGYTPDVTANKQYATANKYGYSDQYYNSLINPTYAQNIAPGGLASTEEKAKAAALSKLLQDPAYNQFTTGDAFTDQSIAATQDRANTLNEEQRQRFLNQIPLSQLMQIDGFGAPAQAFLDQNYSDSAFNQPFKEHALSSSLAQLLKDYSGPQGEAQSPGRQSIEDLIASLNRDFSSSIPLGRQRPQGT